MLTLAPAVNLGKDVWPRAQRLRLRVIAFDLLTPAPRPCRFGRSAEVIASDLDPRSAQGRWCAATGPIALIPMIYRGPLWSVEYTRMFLRT